MASLDCDLNSIRSERVRGKEEEKGGAKLRERGKQRVLPGLARVALQEKGPVLCGCKIFWQNHRGPALWIMRARHALEPEMKKHAGVWPKPTRVTAPEEP